MENIYLCKVPIFDKNQNLVAYEIKYDYENEDFKQTVKKLYSLISDIDIVSILSGKEAFIKVTSDILIFTEFLNLIPKEIFTIMIDYTNLKSKNVQEKVKEYKNDGYRYAIDLNSLEDIDINFLISFSGLFNFIFIDVSNLSDKKINLIHDLCQLPFTLIAKNVDSLHDFNKAKDLGFELFEGEFFKEPEKLESDTDIFNKIDTLKIIRYVHEEDDLNEVAEVIKANPEISVALLKYVNSSFFYLRNPITSVNRAVIYLGKKNLINWLMLISMMSVSNKDTDREVVKATLFRGKFMELLSKEINEDINIAETAFLIGILSFAERIFKAPLSTILRHLNLSEELEKDIKEGKGYYGELLFLVKAIEKNDRSKIDEFITIFNIPKNKISELTVESYKWVENLSKLI
ncbi:MAG TPA: HDOD domain-containing protein [Sulfurihydrogenibium sp.]|uniref:EAL and HDOD domain-containing protein n=1 Tax=Sulfurihydrogenibium sp. (strain YO3AOP1) TaxID=436114 RepID=UPI0001750C4F|nr:HDOD domain-containing protein [Sulfurihydrogenibium sp. YO3AOP1]ACD67078.1 putative signal transduction protein [Sulfurihydrogenibium sp. YO3AOP1]HBT98671.1 HDOD domain-containing protein [Sulfurihydrogenibium sp.]